MQFFLALGILIAACSVYLLHQFWSSSLSTDDAPLADAAFADSDAQKRTPKAA
jgi:hypothetical protein